MRGDIKPGRFGGVTGLSVIFQQLLIGYFGFDGPAGLTTYVGSRDRREASEKI